MYNNYYSVNTYDNGYLMHSTNNVLNEKPAPGYPARKIQYKKYNDYINSVIRDGVKQAKAEKIRSERECIQMTTGRHVHFVFSWPINDTVEVERDIRDAVLLKRYGSTDIEKVAEGMGKEVFNILRFTKTSKPYSGPAVTLRHSMDDRYLAHHGILGMKWGVRRYQNEDGTLTEAGKKRYREYDFGDAYFNHLKKSANRSTKKLAFTSGAVPLATLAPAVVLGGISVPTYLAFIGSSTAMGALSAQVARGTYYLAQKLNNNDKNRFTRKLEKDRIKNGVK